MIVRHYELSNLFIIPNFTVPQQFFFQFSIIIEAKDQDGGEVKDFKVFVDDKEEELNADGITTKKTFKFEAVVKSIKVKKAKYTDAEEVKDYKIEDKENKISVTLTILKVF